MKRLYSAICGWLEADAAMRSTEHEAQREGNNFAQAERADQPQNDELHAAYRPESIHNDDGGAYRLGFTGGRWQ
ncbi:hypothetical protein [Micrococcus sp. TA1]|uniref:hypothetical protein n=1 Tax=Micrococcus sp. TA1 TaxID=681627 RepID=UPI0016075973|nr:hypothetical protein [Micrococcus sp. TA1]MBB5748554.1 hypothetical protein [Micrococcus sp. TA1]